MNDVRVPAIQKSVSRLGTVMVLATPLLMVLVLLGGGTGGRIGWIVAGGWVAVGSGLQLCVMWWEGRPRRERRRQARARVMQSPPPGSRHSVEILIFPRVGHEFLARSAVAASDGEAIAWRSGLSEGSAEQRARRWCARHLDLRNVMISSRRIDGQHP